MKYTGLENMQKGVQRNFKSVSSNSMDKIQSKGGMQHIKSPFQENKKPSSLNIVTGL